MDTGLAILTNVLLLIAIVGGYLGYRSLMQRLTALGDAVNDSLHRVNELLAEHDKRIQELSGVTVEGVGEEEEK